MRQKEDWMTFTQREIDLLSEEAWQSYKERRCLCAAREWWECFCGAWDNVETK